MLGNIAFDAGRIEPAWDNAIALLNEGLKRLVSIPMSQGYPLALTIAHYHARIPPEEACAVARGAGLSGEESSRSMLDIYGWSKCPV